jgi:uncharacterized protein YjbJ (UPF0337 family)
MSSGTKDKVKGNAQQVGGKIKEETGDALDDREMEVKGKAKKAEGEARETRGKFKDAVDRK